MPGPAWLILPTYNEAENIERFVAAVLPHLEAAATHGHHVLIVDDGSPDGTGDIADRLAQEHEHVSVLHRTVKEGLGPAYLAGFAHALDAGAGHVLEMDSDFSHDPPYLRAMLGAAMGGADLVLGSRYVPGGGVADWGIVRRLVSRGGCWYAQRVLSVHVRDLTGGFKCFRREVLETIDLPSVRSQGYAFQVELTYRALGRGYEVVEIPIVFRDRQAGTSKMSWRIAFEAFWLVPRMRARRRSSRTDPAVTDPAAGAADHAAGRETTNSSV